LLLSQAQAELEELSSTLRDELYSAVADVTEQQAAQLESRPDTAQVGGWLLQC